jgi:hypothetical protein
MKHLAKLLLPVIIGVVTLPAYANLSNYGAALDRHLSSYSEDDNSHRETEIQPDSNKHQVVTLPAYANQSHYGSLDKHLSSYSEDNNSHRENEIQRDSDTHHEDKDMSTSCKKCGKSSLFALKDGDIQLTFLSSSAGFSDDLFLAGTSNNIFNNHLATAGQVFTLSNIKAGAEIVFGLFVNDTNSIFFSGNSKRNDDGVNHAKFSTLENNNVEVSFEDLYGGGDKDYNDLIFSVSNVKIGGSSTLPVPESNSLLMIILGLLLIGFSKFRSAKSFK